MANILRGQGTGVFNWAIHGLTDQARQAIDDHSQRLKRLAARVTRVVDTTERYSVEMTDPDGNWFCIQ